MTVGTEGVTRWRKKPVEVEMIRWDGSEEAWQLIANHGGLPERLPDGSVNIWVEASQAEMNLDAGAWAVIEPDGSGVYPCRAADQAAAYEPVTAPGEGVTHYDVTREALIRALTTHPLTEQLIPQARERMADRLLGQMPEASPLVTGEQAQADYEVTLATLRNIAERTLATAAGTDSSRGYRRAMQDVKAVLDKHGAPPDEPVHFGEQP